MTEAGPSSTSATPSGSFAGTNSATSVSRSFRFQFPKGDHDGVRTRNARPEGNLSRMASLGIGHTPSSRTGGNTGVGTASSPNTNHESSIRRRVKSVDEVQSAMPRKARVSRAQDIELEPHTRTLSIERKGVSRRFARTPEENADESTDLSTAPFSDEYDIDPRILEDVQRALKLKARREARLKTSQSHPPLKDTVLTSDQASSSSFSTHSSSALRTNPPDFQQATTQPAFGSVESDIDFSPAVGSIPLHPVPSSSNGGATLDWTGSGSEDERDKRWALHITKRKPKEKHSVYANRIVVEKQESLYADRLAVIKAKVKPHTLRKAAITAEQVQRRYAALLGSSPVRNASVNLLNAARWYSKQESVVQSSLDHAEPLTWLKHLLEKRSKASSSRLPWHLTALIIEEFAKSLTRPEVMETIPEDAALGTSSHAPDSSPFVAVVVSHDAELPSKSPSTSGSWSWSPPPQSLEPSLSRKRRPSYDGPVSFEPKVDSGRESVGGDSRRSSSDPASKRKQSLTYGTDSPRSSIQSGALNGSWNYGMSPGSSRMHLRDIAKRIRRKPHHGSDDGLSSGRNSISEHSHEDDTRPAFKGRSRSRPLSIQMRFPGHVVESEEDHASRSASDRALSSGGEGPLTAKQVPSPYVSPEEPTVKPPERITSPDLHTPPPQLQPIKLRPPVSRRPRRMSLPSLGQLLSNEQAKRQLQADEEQERNEYDHKTQLLEDTIAQNHRTRQLLQRVGANVREYDNVQSRLSLLLGTPHSPIPLEVLDAFSHDPASVTSGTKRFKSWRAVEDISDRINRQRETLLTFATSFSLREGSGSTTPSSVFDGQIATVSHSLEQLEGHRRHLAVEADEVAETLARVKNIHSTVKKAYNDVLSHTSLIYPELSQVVALEESYRNKYQQFWDIGLDALTLLLDTVTPVWRNYGKVIGEDVQDFLIIPWYRNEFTGEQRRYPIAHLPKRPVRHWLGLLVFSVTSICIALLQMGAAVSSTLNYNLPWIAHTGFRWMFVPIFSIGLIIQWCAVLIECAIVFAEIGVVTWWLGWAVKIFH